MTQFPAFAPIPRQAVPITNTPAKSSAPNELLRSTRHRRREESRQPGFVAITDRLLDANAAASPSCVEARASARRGLRETMDRQTCHAPWDLGAASHAYGGEFCCPCAQSERCRR